MNFRNSARIDKGSWHANTRGLPARSRRDAETTTITSINDISHLNTTINDEKGHAIQIANATNSTRKSVASSATATVTAAEINNANNNASNKVAFVSSSASTELQTTNIAAGRKRRDAPLCITNYKAQRQLWVGCTDENIIDVRPLCTDEGDEGKW